MKKMLNPVAFFIFFFFYNLCFFILFHLYCFFFLFIYFIFPFVQLFDPLKLFMGASSCSYYLQFLLLSLFAWALVAQDITWVIFPHFSIFPFFFVNFIFFFFFFWVKIFFVLWNLKPRGKEKFYIFLFVLLISISFFHFSFFFIFWLWLCCKIWR